MKLCRKISGEKWGIKCVLIPQHWMLYEQMESVQGIKMINEMLCVFVYLLSKA